MMTASLLGAVFMLCGCVIRSSGGRGGRDGDGDGDRDPRPGDPNVLIRADTYEICDSSADCESSFDQCLGITPPDGFESSMCSHTCGGSEDCEYGGVCADYASSGVSLCFRACTSNLDCELGFECLSLGAFGNGCFPDGSGN